MSTTDPTGADHTNADGLSYPEPLISLEGLRPGKLVAVLAGGRLVTDMVDSINSLQEFYPNETLMMGNDISGDFEVRTAGAPCGCHTCLNEDRAVRSASRPDASWLRNLGFAGMVVCAQCGNKRCPMANDHRNPCSGSNLPGQPGSAYPVGPLDV